MRCRHICHVPKILRGFTLSHSKGSGGDARVVYDESFERVLRRCDVVRQLCAQAFRKLTMNHSKGPCGDAMSSDMPCAQDFRELTMNHSKGPCGDATSSDMLCPRRWGLTMSHSKGSCDDAMSSNMFGAQDLGAHDESLDRVLRRRDVVRHAMCPRFGSSR